MSKSVEILRHHRSIRKYKPEHVREEDLEAILEAGMYAASASNKQPTLMVVVQNKEIRDKFSRMNAAVMNSNNDPFYGAPDVIVVLADTTTNNWKQDGALVLGNLMNAAYAVGVGSCWNNRAYEMFETEEGREYLRSIGVPDSYSGVGNCILGYPDETPEDKPRREGRIICVK